MTSLRCKFIRELTLRGRAERTIQGYVAWVAALAKYYNRSPDQLSNEQIRVWLAHLRSERRLSASSLNVAVQAVRAFQEWVLGHEREACVRGVPKCKRDTVRAEVYAMSEIAALLKAANPGRDHVLLSLIYGCGLRRDDARLLRTGGEAGPEVDALAALGARLGRLAASVEHEGERLVLHLAFMPAPAGPE